MGSVLPAWRARRRVSAKLTGLRCAGYPRHRGARPGTWQTFSQREPHLLTLRPSEGCRGGGQVRARARPATPALQGLWAAGHTHGAARQAGGGEGRGHLALLHRLILEGDWQAAGRISMKRNVPSRTLPWFYLDARSCARVLPQAR